MYNITLEYYLLEILLVSSNRYLLNGGVILRIYYVREISINLLSRFLRKESCRSIFLLLFFFFFFFLSTMERGNCVELLNSICFSSGMKTGRRGTRGSIVGSRDRVPWMGSGFG